MVKSLSPISLPADPTTLLGVSPKQYVDNRIAVSEFKGNAIAAGIETLSRYGLITNMTSTSGQLRLSYFVPAKDIPLTKLFVSSGDAVAAGITLARIALLIENADLSVTKVAQTASDTAIGAATYTTYERAMSTVGGFPSSYTILGGVRYAIGFIQVGTTPCTLGGVYVSNENALPRPAKYVNSQTDIAASYTAAGLTTDYRTHYFGGLS